MILPWHQVRLMIQSSRKQKGKDSRAHVAYVESMDTRLATAGSKMERIPRTTAMRNDSLENAITVESLDTKNETVGRKGSIKQEQ